jgi:hypothetical protein
MDKNEIEKRMNAAVDILTFLDQQIAQQVEHQVEQRLEREREKWRSVLVDLLVAERKHVIAHVFALLEKEVGELVGRSHNKMIDRVEQMLDRVEAKLSDPMHRSVDDMPPSKH